MSIHNPLPMRQDPLQLLAGWWVKKVDGSFYRYPPKMIPSVKIIIQTTATNDNDGRLLLSGMGVPFYGKHYN